MEEIIALTETCTHCSAVIPKDQKFCEDCGFPIQGTDSEKAKYHAEKVIAHNNLKDAPRVIRKARNTLFVISGLSFIGGLFYFFVQDDIATFVSSAILAVVYLLLGFWSQKKPLMALVLAFFLFLTTIVINGVIAPETIFSGIILKVIVIVFLIKGIKSAQDLNKA